MKFLFCAVLLCLASTIVGRAPYRSVCERHAKFLRKTYKKFLIAGGATAAVVAAYYAYRYGQKLSGEQRHSPDFKCSIG